MIPDSLPVPERPAAITAAAFPPPLHEAAEWLVAQYETDPEPAQALLERGAGAVAILRELGVDDEGLTVGLLQAGSPYSGKQCEQLRKRFGGQVATLLHGVERLADISALSRSGGDDRRRAVSDENLRKMLIAMVDDVRVVPIKLADHLCRLRSLKDAPENEKRAAAEQTLDLYAPLANRLGIWQLKWELEDFALRYLEPERYREIARRLAEKRVARERYIDEFIRILDGALEKAGVRAEVYGRPKHIFSIWKKMRRKGLAFENISDVRAVRVLVDDVAGCYSALGAVHMTWRHLPGEFDDYIATPKENGYRSIHTVVIGPEEKAVEIQIRTREMHEENELGVAAHWRYKENARQDESIDSKVQWLRQLLEWKDELDGDSELADRFRNDVFEQRVYVFTPKGTVIDLPQGSTPVDFAYAVHTEVGHRTRGARINGRIVPLTTQLQTGDQVEILTAKDGRPSRDWLRSDAGYVRTNRARSRIQRWFKLADHDQHVAAGRTMLERELKRLGLDDLSYDKLARESDYTGADDLLAAIGSGDFKLSRAVAPFRKAVAGPEPELPRSRAGAVTRTLPAGFSVQGVGNLLTSLAQCCLPVPGDAIIGFITQGRGVTVHQNDCVNIRNLEPSQRSRLIDVEWAVAESASFPVEVGVTAYNRSGLLHDVTEVLNDAKVGVMKANLETLEDDTIVRISMRIEITGLQKLSGILARLEQIPNVFEVRRITR